jgi:hypothetical protein
MASTTPPTDAELLTELLAEQRRSNEYLRVLMQPQLRERLEALLGSSAERRAYEASDGTRTGREIAAVARVSTGAVSGWGKKWRQAGVAVEVDGHLCHLLPLSALDIDVEGDEAE